VRLHWFNNKVHVLISVEDFRERIKANAFAELLDNYMLAGPARHVEQASIDFIKTKLWRKYNVSDPDGYVGVVGSAKLGFATNEKRLADGKLLPRYRRFSAESDIDVVVVSAPIFNAVWNDLCAHAHRSATSLPWNSGVLGDYLVYGWLRPDHFPMNVRLRKCDDWWDVFRTLSADLQFGRHQIRGGLFHSLEHLRRYQNRTLGDCARAEAMNI
jgi:hypothetical protein